jgi:hypothetical protein
MHQKTRNHYPINRDIFDDTNASSGISAHYGTRLVIAEDGDDYRKVSENIAHATAQALQGLGIHSIVKTRPGEFGDRNTGLIVKMTTPYRVIAQAIKLAIGATASPNHGDRIENRVRTATIISADEFGNAEIDINAEHLLSALGIDTVYSDSYIQCDDCQRYIDTQPGTYDDNPNDRYQIHPDGYAICDKCASTKHASAEAYREAYQQNWIIAFCYKDDQRANWPDSYAGILPYDYRIAGYLPWNLLENHTPANIARLIIAGGYQTASTDGHGPIIRQARYSKTEPYRYTVIYAPPNSRAHKAIVAANLPGFTTIRPTADL